MTQAARNGENNLPRRPVMWRVGNSDIMILPANPGWARFRLPMPPSVNVRLRPVYRVRSGPSGRRAGMELKLTEAVVGYYQNALALRMAWKRVLQKPLEDFVKITFRFFLANPLYDTHNGLKVACDMIQKSGMILSDRFILPKVAMPESSPADPRMLIEFEVPKGFEHLRSPEDAR